MRSIVLPHRPKPVSEAIKEHLLQLVIPAEDAAQSTPAMQELERMMCPENIEILALGRRILRQQHIILEDRILADRFRTAPPADELELRYPQVCLQVEFPPGVAGT